MAIQLIINKEWGLAINENPNQGSFIIEELTDLVEEAVLLEFDFCHPSFAKTGRSLDSDSNPAPCSLGTGLALRR